MVITVITAVIFHFCIMKILSLCDAFMATQFEMQGDQNKPNTLTQWPLEDEFQASV